MKATRSRSVIAAALCASVLACDQGTAPATVVLPPPTPNAGGATAYLAAKTVARSGSGTQSVAFALDERDHSLFMEPFVLHVQQTGASAVRGAVFVDGQAVLDERDLAVIGTDPYSLEIPVTPTSVITVELTGPAGGALTLRVDAPPQPAPVITITSPTRAAPYLEVGSEAVEPVQITGTACHARYPIAHLQIAGTDVPVSGSNLCEPFAVTQESRWGMSFITGTARNTRGREGTVVQSYVRGRSYYDPPEAGDLARSVRGLYSHLTQAAIDDGIRTDADDLATLFRNLLNARPNVLPASTLRACDDVFEVRMPSQQVVASIAITSVTANANDIAFDISINNPSIAISVRADANPFDGDCDGTLVENGVFSATSIRITATLRAAPTVGAVPRISVSVVQSSVTVNGANATSTSTIAQGLLSGLTGLASGLLNSFIGQFVIDLLHPTFAELLMGFVPTLSEELSFNGATVRVQSGFSTVAHGAQSNGPFLRMGLYGHVTPVTHLAGLVAPRGPLKNICGTECAGGVTALPVLGEGSNTFGVALHQDMLNQTLWSAWRAGAFKQTIGSLEIDATMPPVSMATSNDDPMAELRWGNLRVRTTLDPTEIGLPAGPAVVVDSWVSATFRGDVQFVGATGRLGLIDMTGSFDVQLLGDPLVIDAAVVRAAIIAKLQAHLEAFTRDGLGLVPMPQGQPRIVNPTVTRSGFFYVLNGTLQ